MKIFIVNRFLWPDESATSQLATDLATELALRGFDVVGIASRQMHAGPQTPLPRSGEIGGVRIERVHTTRFGRSKSVGRVFDYLSFCVSASLRLMRMLRRDDVLIAMTDPPLLSLVCAPIARFRRAKLVNWVQDLFPEVAISLETPIPGILVRCLKTLRDASFKGAHANVVIGKRMAELISRRGMSVTVIPNWALEEGEGDGSEFRAAWALTGKFVIGYSGNMGRAHQFGCLLDLADTLKDDAGIAFLFIGEGAQRDALEQAAAARQLRNVFFRPHQPRSQLRNSLSVPSIHVVTLDPRLEGLVLPSKFVGAIAVSRGILWLGDPDGEIGNLVEVTKCGFVVDRERAHEVARKIRVLASTPSAAEDLGRLAFHLYKTEFSRDLMIGRWIEIVNLISGGMRLPIALSTEERRTSSPL